MPYSLIDHTREFICRKRFRGHSSPHFYPSEASVQIVNEFGEKEVLGNCLRASYFRCVGEDGRPHSAKSQMYFLLGKAVEKMLIDEWREMGIFVANAVRFENPEYHISGELDVVLREPGTNTLFGTEIKSIAGYRADVEIFGNKHNAGKPKMNQLLQALIYAHEFRNTLAYFKMFYQERGTGDQAEFNVYSTIDERSNGTIIYTPSIDGVPLNSFTINDVYDRYKLLQDHLTQGTPPDKDFQIYYTDDVIEQRFAQKRLSKSKYQEFKKKGNKARPGDWQCFPAYCSYSHICWK